MRRFHATPRAALGMLFAALFAAACSSQVDSPDSGPGPGKPGLDAGHRASDPACLAPYLSGTQVGKVLAASGDKNADISAEFSSTGALAKLDGVDCTPDQALSDTGLCPYCPWTHTCGLCGFRVDIPQVGSFVGPWYFGVTYEPWHSTASSCSKYVGANAHIGPTWYLSVAYRSPSTKPACPFGACLLDSDCSGSDRCKDHLCTPPKPDAGTVIEKPVQCGGSGDSCPRQVCCGGNSGTLCCQPPFCSGDCVGSPCCH